MWTLIRYFKPYGGYSSHISFFKQDMPDYRRYVYIIEGHARLYTAIEDSPHIHLQICCRPKSFLQKAWQAKHLDIRHCMNMRGKKIYSTIWIYSYRHTVFLLCMFKETHMLFLAYTEISYMGLVIWVLYGSNLIYMVLCVFRPKDLWKTLIIWYDMLQALIALSQHLWISLDFSMKH